MKTARKKAAREMDLAKVEKHARRISLGSDAYLKQPIRKDYSDEFYTPDEIPAALGTFDLDPSAGPKSHAKKNIRLPKDGLRCKWKGRVWLNPPYSNIHDWLARFIRHGNGICLVNARCETGWFQRLAQHADTILLLRGRVQFQRPGKTDTHPTCGSVLVAYGRRNAKALLTSRLAGIVMRREVS